MFFCFVCTCRAQTILGTHRALVSEREAMLGLLGHEKRRPELVGYVNSVVYVLHICMYITLKKDDVLTDTMLFLIGCLSVVPSDLLQNLDDHLIGSPKRSFFVFFFGIGMLVTKIGNTIFEEVYVRVTDACYKHGMTGIMNFNDPSLMFLTFVKVDLVFVRSASQNQCFEKHT